MLIADASDNRAYLIAKLEHVRGSTVTTIAQAGSYMRGKLLGGTTRINDFVVELASKPVNCLTTDTLRMTLVRDQAQGTNDPQARMTFRTDDGLINEFTIERVDQ